MNIRPVRLAPCAAGARPTISNRGRSDPQPGTGRPQYGWSANARRLTTATSSRQVTSRGQARHTLIVASSSATDARPLRPASRPGRRRRPPESAPSPVHPASRCREQPEKRTPGRYSGGGAHEHPAFRRSPSVNSVASASASALHSAAISHEQQQPRPGISSPVRHVDGVCGRRHLAGRVPVAGAAARRQRRTGVDRGRRDDAAAAVLHAGRGHRGRLLRSSPGVDDLPMRCPGRRWPPFPVVAWAFGTQAVNVTVLAALGACAAAFDPAGMTARQSMLPEAAARAGWSLDRVNSIYEAILNLAFIVGPGHRRPDDRDGRRHHHDVDHRRGVRVVHPGDLRSAARRRRQAAHRGPARRSGVRGSRRGCVSCGTCGCCACWR